MPDHIPLPAKQYSVIYADPPWAYSQGGNTKSSHGIAKQHYPTMTTAEICALPVREIVREGAACFMWATFPNITEAIKVMEAWGFTYKTAAFVWVKKNRKQGGNFMGLGAYTRANAEVCLLGVTPGFKAKTQIRAHNVHQINLTYYINRSDSARAVAIQAAVAQAVEEYKTWQRTIGRDVNPSQLAAMVMEAGAKRVTVTAPTFAAVAATKVAALTGSATVTYGGLEDD